MSSWIVDGALMVVFVVFILTTASTLTAFSNEGKLDATSVFLAIGILAFFFREFAIHLDLFTDGLFETIKVYLKTREEIKN